MKTVRGIYYNLKESEYVFTIGTIKFYFSSKMYRDKFMSRYLEERKRFNQALNHVYKDKFNLLGDMLAWVRLYVTIEKRGFYINIEGNDVTCLDDLVFVVTLNYKMKFDA
jgi:hypothetical protein